ncbi:hypothetical protein FBU30_009720 [Linnemannia zychae]|nr:hypothetical protein FBU30_009720 [Linnemannia zychae]
MPLPNPWYCGEGFPITLLPELNMMALSNAIREKPQWWLKYKDPEIAAKWREEAAGNDRSLRYRLRPAEMDYVFKELEWYAVRRQEQIDNGVEVTIDVGVEGTRRADGLIPEDLKKKLLECIKKLEDIPDHLKDWHPGSNKQVLDLVHPSLFPFIAGRTLVTKEEAAPALEWIGAGAILKTAPISDSRYLPDYSCSNKFQWLPTDFEVTQKGQTRAKSYINNLHPEIHKDMYPVLEEILESFLPMFEEVLGEMEVINSKPKRLHTDPFNWHEGEEPALDDMDWWDFHRNRVPKPLEIPEFEIPDEIPKYDLVKPGSRLQVIVKLANIELTPENPSYDGGVWHVEGMGNENIVATAIYYYHSENITESRLNFRIEVEEPEYAQSDEAGVSFMYDLRDDEPQVQYLGGVITKEDRCLVFPNIYQHQVQPFSLVDPTKPGSRKILVFFLVNPEIPILSTTNVPPQQAAWVNRRDSISNIFSCKLPPELVNEIDSVVDWPIRIDEAELHRAELMKERKVFVKVIAENYIARPFSLCEH